MIVLDEGASVRRWLAVRGAGAVLARLIRLLGLGPIIKIDLDPGREGVVMRRGSTHVVEGDQVGS